METEILAELSQIKWILLALFVAIFITILFSIVALAMKVKSSNTEILLQLRDNYLGEMALLEAKGDYENLLNKSDEMLQTYPNDLLANWYNALANHKIGQLGAALSALGRVKKINSSWSTDSVDSLISEIKSEMSGPRAHDA